MHFSINACPIRDAEHTRTPLPVQFHLWTRERLSRVARVLVQKGVAAWPESRLHFFWDLGTADTED